MTDLDQTARRVRAARAYAGLSVNALAERLGVGAQTIKRIEAGRRSARPYELWGISQICGLPREFFDGNFEAMSSEAVAVAGALARLESRLDDIERVVTAAYATASNGFATSHN
jgi:transcriptional regulator with XRE-family HTH domain